MLNLSRSPDLLPAAPRARSTRGVMRNLARTATKQAGEFKAASMREYETAGRRAGNAVLPASRGAFATSLREVPLALRFAPAESQRLRCRETRAKPGLALLPPKKPLRKARAPALSSGLYPSWPPRTDAN